jgi:transcriptional regulator with XRE-family HTH domain
VEAHHELKAEDLGARVRAVRELAGADQRDVAKKAGMSRRELQAAERGAKRLSTAELHAIAAALGVDPDVLVGVGFEGELARASVVDRGRGEDPRASDGEWPPPLPVNAPNSERRRDYVTRERIERSWRDVRDEMADSLTSCARLVSAGSGDDIRRLIERLDRDLTQLKAKQTFLRALADHERALERARGTGGNVPVAPAAAVSPVAAGGTGLIQGT